MRTKNLIDKKILIKKYKVKANNNYENEEQS